MNIELVVCDLDGTLVDSVSDIAIAASQALEYWGMPSPLKEDGGLDPVFYKDTVDTLGYGLSYTIDKLAKKYIPQFDSITYKEKQYGIRLGLQYYLDHPADTTRFYDGVVESLQAIADMGIEISILSNKDDDLVQVVVGILFADIPLRLVRGAKDGIMKPQKEAFRIVSTGRKAIMVGDLNSDVNTAINANVPFVGAGWGNYAATVEAPDHTVLAHPSELLDYIKARNGAN